MSGCKAPLVVSAIAASLAATIPSTADGLERSNQMQAIAGTGEVIAQRPELRAPARRLNLPSNVRVVRGNPNAVSPAALRQIQSLAARIRDVDEGRSADGSTWTQISCSNGACEKIVTWTETSESGEAEVSIAADTRR